MRAILDFEIEACRITKGPLASTNDYGMNGAFHIWTATARSGTRRRLNVIASNGGGWEHVSVTLRDHPYETPTWREMQWVKTLFWDDEETVVQIHPPASRYVNEHPGCLHLWRPIEGPGLPLPPVWMLA